MPVTSVKSDPASLTLTAIGEYPVPVERLWDAWADPRQLERFWGPPEWPATFTRLDMEPGGRAEYHMRGPNGEVSHGYWIFDRVERPRVIEVRDGFANPDNTPNTEMPTIHMRFTFEGTDGGSRFVAVSTFPSLEALEQLVAMGMVEGLTAALGQLDDVLADLREYAAGRSTEIEIVDDTHVAITRLIRGTIDQVWRAHNEASLMQKWMLGPDGWTMPVCEVAQNVGDTYRYEWVDEAGENRFGFTGELLENEPPRRSVTTERMIGTDGPGTQNELVLEPRPGGHTLLRVTITYPTKELRDMILGTGMVDGMEASYARMEQVLG